MKCFFSLGSGSVRDSFPVSSWNTAWKLSCLPLADFTAQRVCLFLQTCSHRSGTITWFLEPLCCFQSKGRWRVERGAGSSLVWVWHSQELAVIKHYWPIIRSPQYLGHCPTFGHRKKELKKSRSAQVPDSSPLWFSFFSLCKSFWNCTIKKKTFSRLLCLLLKSPGKHSCVGMHPTNYTTARAKWPILEENVLCHIWQLSQDKGLDTACSN